MEYLGHEVTDRLAGISGRSRPAQPLVDEELHEIEGEGPEQEDGDDGSGGVAEDVGEVPLLGPLIEGGVVFVPSRTVDAMDGLDRQPPGAFANHLLVTQ